MGDTLSGKILAVPISIGKTREDMINIAYAIASAMTATWPMPSRPVAKIGETRFVNFVTLEPQHFSSCDSIAEQAVNEIQGDVCRPFNILTQGAPSLPDINYWGGKLGGHPQIPPMSVSSAVVNSIKNSITEDVILAIRAKLLITEPEAAILLSKSPKALGNDRRKGRIPRNLYLQHCEGGKILYVTEEVIMFIETTILQRRKENTTWNSCSKKRNPARAGPGRK